MNPPMQDDDGFGDFRAKVKGLPPEQRKAALTEMEQAIITNLRTNMLADLYEDQPPPAPQPGQPPQGDQTMRAPMPGRQPPQGRDPQQPGKHGTDRTWYSGDPVIPGEPMPAFEDVRDMEEYKETLRIMSGEKSNDPYLPRRVPTPGSQPPTGSIPIRPSTGDPSLDASLGRTTPAAVDYNSPEYKQYLREYSDELRAGGMTPENDPQSWRAAMDEAYMGFNPSRPQPQGTQPMRQPMRQPMQRGPAPSIIDEAEPEALEMVQPTKFQTPQGGRQQMDDQQLQDRGRTIMGPGGQQQPAWGSGDGFVDENDPDQPAYTSPLPRGSMRGKPYPTEREFGGGDDYYSHLYRWEKDNGAPKWQEGTNDGGPEWNSFVDEYHRKNNLPPRVDERKFEEFIGRETGLSGQDLYDVMIGQSDAVNDEQYNALLEKFRSQGKPNPRGAFGVPPGGKPTHPIGAY